MSKYKPLYSSIWTDSKFENYSPEKKLIYIFLLTNQYVERSGIYKISLRQISFNTCITNDVINNVINELINEGKISYDFENGIIFVKNLFKYQKGMIKNENILLLTLKRNYELVKTVFWNEFLELYSSDSLASKINNLLIDGSLMAHQLYINTNTNVNKDKHDNNKKQETTNLINNEFEEFWQAYNPVKTKEGKMIDKGSKKTAKIAYEKALKKYSADQIFNGIQDYLFDCYQNNRLTCQVSVALNQERFIVEQYKTLNVK